MSGESELHPAVVVPTAAVCYSRAVKSLMKLIKIGLTLAVVAGIGFCAFVNLANAPGRSDAEAANRTSAEQVIAALTAYREAHGEYPESLETLVPAQLPTLPVLEPPSNEVRYERSADASGFGLTYAETPFGVLPSDAEHTYNSVDGKWGYVVY